MYKAQDSTVLLIEYEKVKDLLIKRIKIIKRRQRAKNTLIGPGIDFVLGSIYYISNATPGNSYNGFYFFLSGGIVGGFTLIGTLIPAHKENLFINANNGLID